MSGTVASSAVDWSEVTLADCIASIEAGTSVNSEDRQRAMGEIAVLKTSAVASGSFYPDKHKVVVESDKRRASCPVRGGTIILSRMNTKELVGESGYVPADDPELFLPDRLWAITARADTSARWLSHVLASPAMRDTLGSRATGTSGSMKNISQPVLLGTPITKPSLVEQRRLAAVLDTWDDAVATAEQLAVALRREQSALVQRALLADRVASVRLGEVATINPPSDKLSTETIVTFIAMEDVSDAGTILTRRTRRRGDLGAGYTPFAERDTLIAKITPCFENGKGAFAYNLTGGAGFGSTEFHVLRPRADVDPRFVYHHTRTPRFRQQGEAMMSGSAGQKRVPREFIEDYRVPILDRAEQRRAVALLDAAASRIADIGKLVESFRRQKRGLMQKLLTGQWRVPATGDAFIPGGSAIERLEAAE